MKYIVKTFYIILSIFFLYYLSLPDISYPPKIEGSLQSSEPADKEDPLRRSYYTDDDRGQVIAHYISNMRIGGLFENVMTFTPIRLNYPPEEAQTIVRDQTRSTFLEEMVFPMRESFFINGYKPSGPGDVILIDNKYWGQKITVKHVPSNLSLRILIGILIIALIPLLFNEYKLSIKNVYVNVRRMGRTKII